MSIRNHIKVLAIVIVFVSGCRTYGGYDTKELNVETLTEIAEQVSASAAMAESERSLLAQASSQDPSLSGFVDEYSLFLDRHNALAASLTTDELPTSYLGASRAIGAAISEMNIVSRGYEQVKMATSEHLGNPVGDVSNVKDDITYEVVPPFYRRIDLHQSLSMRDVLN